MPPAHRGARDRGVLSARLPPNLLEVVVLVRDAGKVLRDAPAEMTVALVQDARQLLRRRATGCHVRAHRLAGDRQDARPRAAVLAERGRRALARREHDGPPRHGLPRAAEAAASASLSVGEVVDDVAHLLLVLRPLRLVEDDRQVREEPTEPLDVDARRVPRVHRRRHVVGGAPPHRGRHAHRRRLPARRFAVEVDDERRRAEDVEQRCGGRCVERHPHRGERLHQVHRLDPLVPCPGRLPPVEHALHPLGRDHLDARLFGVGARRVERIRQEEPGHVALTDPAHAARCLVRGEAVHVLRLKLRKPLDDVASRVRRDRHLKVREADELLVVHHHAAVHRAHRPPARGAPHQDALRCAEQHVVRAARDEDRRGRHALAVRAAVRRDRHLEDAGRVDGPAARHAQRVEHPRLDEGRRRGAGPEGHGHGHQRVVLHDTDDPVQRGLLLLHHEALERGAERLGARHLTRQ